MKTHEGRVANRGLRTPQALRFGVVLLLVGTAFPQERADYGVDALRARVAALTPDVEAALGASLGDPVEIQVTSRSALADLLAEEFKVQRGNIAGGARGEQLNQACRAEATFAAELLLAKVDLQRGTIHLCPDNFQKIAELDPSWAGLLTPDALDAVLLHEIVHVFQVRRYGLARFVGTPSSIEQLVARTAVIEGHAQYVGRLAAQRRDLEAALALTDRILAEVPAGIEDPAERHFAEIVGANLSFAYVEGEKFFDAAVEKLGYETAVERLFARPPATLRAVSRPDEYFDPPPPDTSLDRVASRVQRLLVERGHAADILPLAAPVLRAALTPAGAEVTESALSAYDKGVLVISSEDEIVVGLLRGRDEDAAKTLYEADLATTRAKDELFGKPGAQLRIVSATYEPLALDGMEGTESSKVVEFLLGQRQLVETVFVRRRDLIVEVTAGNAAAAPGQAVRLTREVLELLRGAEVADPWDGTRGDAARRALLAALDDAHWGVRWRAIRNLARLGMDAEVEAALTHMLRDPDATVRCGALRALAQRGWFGRASASDRDALAGHPDWVTRLEYQRALAQHEETQEEQVEALLAVLDDEHPALRAYAFRMLDDLDAQDRMSWRQLRSGIEDDDGEVRLAALQALGWKPLESEARDLLLDALGDEDARIRDAALDRLDQWVPESAEVVDAIIRALEDESVSVRWSAATALEDAGEAAAPAIPALARLLDDAFVRQAAAETLGKIGIADLDAVERLGESLADPDLDFRFEVARALLRLGGDPESLAPVFGEALRGQRSFGRSAAAKALSDLGDHARPYVKDLVAALEDEDLYFRHAAAESLGRLGTVAREALPALLALGGEGEPEEEPWELNEDGLPVIGLGGGYDEDDVRRAARKAAEQIRAALADEER